MTASEETTATVTNEDANVDEGSNVAPSAAVAGDDTDTMNVSDAEEEENDDDIDDDLPTVTLIAKFKKERITLDGLSPVTTTIGDVKEMLFRKTNILPKRQKLVGLNFVKKAGDETNDENRIPLSDIKAKKKGKDDGSKVITHQFILMGTPEEHIFVDPQDRDDLPDVVDDFDLDFNAGSSEWLRHVANGENLKKFTESTAVHFMHQPRPGKPLLVLDLDHTLLDFSSKSLLRPNQQSTSSPRELAAKMKRPYMDEFLTSAYQHYDLVVWSQTSWRWLETKLIELEMVSNPGYRFCFVLDKTSMFRVTSTKRDGTQVKHHVKPLQIIWSKFGQYWGAHNTVHVDDLSRNFALNLGSGIKVSAYYRKKHARRDNELLGLGRYLEQLAAANIPFDRVDFTYWMDVVAGKRALVADVAAVDENGDKKDGESKD